MTTRKVITSIISAIISIWLATLITNLYESHARYKVIQRGPPPGYCIVRDADGKYFFAIKRYDWHRNGPAFHPDSDVDYIFEEPWVIKHDMVESLQAAWHHYEYDLEVEKMTRERTIQGNTVKVMCNETNIER